MLTEAALADGIGPGTIVNNCLIAAMSLIGERFGRGEIYVPEMLLSARAMQRSSDNPGATYGEGRLRRHVARS